jgi:hypothetical protein
MRWGHVKGDGTLVRYADDALMAFDNIVDARRVLAVLGKRLARFGLTLHPDKTPIVDFRPPTKGAPAIRQRMEPPSTSSA